MGQIFIWHYFLSSLHSSYVAALGQLRAVLYYALKLIHYCQDGHLFADEEKLSCELAEALMMEVEDLSQECFYGRCLGFQVSCTHFLDQWFYRKGLGF